MLQLAQLLYQQNKHKKNVIVVVPKDNEPNVQSTIESNKPLEMLLNMMSMMILVMVVVLLIGMMLQAGQLRSER